MEEEEWKRLAFAAAAAGTNDRDQSLGIANNKWEENDADNEEEMPLLWLLNSKPEAEAEEEAEDGTVEEEVIVTDLESFVAVLAGNKGLCFHDLNNYNPAASDSNIQAAAAAAEIRGMDYNCRWKKEAVAADANKTDSKAAVAEQAVLNAVGPL